MDRAFAIAKWLAEHRLAVLGFAVAVAYWPTFLQGAFTPRWIVIAVGLPLVCSLDPRNVPPGIRGVLLFLFGLAVISTTFSSPDPLTGYYELIFVFLLCVAFIAGAGMVSIDDVMTGLGAGLGVSSYIVLMALNDNDGRGSEDLAALFFNKEVLAEFAALVFVWAVARPNYFVAATSIIPVLFCGSRIAVLVAAIGILYAYRPASKWKMAGIITAIALAAMLAVFAFGPGKMVSAEHRLTLWIAVTMAWTQFGHGLGWFLTYYPLEQFAHSDAIQMVAELGIGAFVVLFIPYYAFRNGGGNRAERATLFAACIQVCVSFPLHFPASGFVVAVVAGCVVGAGNRLRLGARDGRVEDGAGVQREAAAYSGASGRRRHFGVPLSAGPVFATRADARSPKYRHDPAEAV